MRKKTKQYTVDLKVRVTLNRKPTKGRMLKLVKQVADELDSQNKGGLYNCPDVDQHFVDLDPDPQGKLKVDERPGLKVMWWTKNKKGKKSGTAVSEFVARFTGQRPKIWRKVPVVTYDLGEPENLSIREQAAREREALKK